MTTSISIPKSRHRLARSLMGRLDKKDFSELVNFLIQQELDRYYSAEMQRYLLEGDAQSEKQGKGNNFKLRKLEPHGGDSSQTPANENPDEAERQKAT